MEEDRLFREPVHPPSETPPSRLSRISRGIMRMLGIPTTPFVPLRQEDIINVVPTQEEDVPPAAIVTEVAPVEEASSVPATNGSRIVALSRDGESIHIFDQNHTALFSEIVPKGNTARLFDRLARMYMGSGEGTFTDKDVAAHAHASKGTGYAFETVVRAAVSLQEIMPHEVMSYDGRNHMIRFGDITVASSLLDSDEIAEHTGKHSLRTQQELADAINEGKENLTTYDHAIARQDDRAYFVSLQSPEGIMTARVIDAVSQLHGEGISSAGISRVAWEKMTTQERMLFVESDEFAFSSEESQRIESQTLQILRRLTHKLYLTHERYSDSFTLMTEGLTVTYHQEAERDATFSATPQLRPIVTPGQKELLNLTDEQRQAAIASAVRYMSVAHNKEVLSQPDGLEMLTFIMSPTGWWAVRQACAEPDAPYKTPTNAQRYMHKQLKRSLGYNAYMHAFRNRLISGNRSLRRKDAGAVKQVGGRLSGSSDWTLGRNMQEVFSRYMANEALATELPDSGSE